MIPNDKPMLGPVPISNNFTSQLIQPPIRPEFTPIPPPQPVVHMTSAANQPTLFTSIGKNRCMRYKFHDTNISKSLVKMLAVKFIFGCRNLKINPMLGYSIFLHYHSVLAVLSTLYLRQVKMSIFALWNQGHLPVSILECLDLVTRIFVPCRPPCYQIHYRLMQLKSAYF